MFPESSSYSSQDGHDCSDLGCGPSLETHSAASAWGTLDIVLIPVMGKIRAGVASPTRPEGLLTRKQSRFFL